MSPKFSFPTVIYGISNLLLFDEYNRSLWRLGPDLFRRDVRCVPVRPVRVALPDALLELAMGGCGAPNRARQIVCRRKGRRRGIDAASQPACDLLDDPRVTIGIFQ